MLNAAHANLKKLPRPESQLGWYGGMARIKCQGRQPLVEKVEMFMKIFSYRHAAHNRWSWTLKQHVMTINGELSETQAFCTDFSIFFQPKIWEN